MSKPHIVGIGAVARCGKNSLANFLQESLESHGFLVAQYPLATPLKEELDSALLANFNISAFTEKDSEKNLIRDILVSWGQVHRKQTCGTHFTQLADEYIAFLGDVDFVLIPDVRFSQFPTDEIQWLKNRGGMFIYLDRTTNGIKVMPTNEDEAKNSIKLDKMADLHVTWETFGTNVSAGKEIAAAKLSKVLDFFKLN
ncbi:MAG: hypothetical protein WC390_06525 [Sulfurimonas sp.]|jgi:hypothetical protein